MKDKKTLIRRGAFPSTPKSSLREPRILAGLTHLIITKKKIYNPHMTQSTKKAPGLDKINFRILCIIWNSEKKQMMGILKHAIQLRYHPNE